MFISRRAVHAFLSPAVDHSHIAARALATMAQGLAQGVSAMGKLL